MAEINIILFVGVFILVTVVLFSKNHCSAEQFNATHSSWFKTLQLAEQWLGSQWKSKSFQAKPQISLKSQPLDNFLNQQTWDKHRASCHFSRECPNTNLCTTAMGCKQKVTALGLPLYLEHAVAGLGRVTHSLFPELCLQLVPQFLERHGSNCLSGWYPRSLR